ncbi:MAG TPA: NAD-dependent epimerase/dehydratase family protein, partial [Blastocatellia bacterium]
MMKVERTLSFRFSSRIIPNSSSMPDKFPYERVVVTGGAGFLGSYVVERLRQRGVEN